MAIKPSFGKPLTPREQEVLQYIAMGWREKEIAAHLWLEIRTIHGYKWAAFDKLGARTAAHAVTILNKPRLEALERIHKLVAELQSSEDLTKLGVAVMIEQRLQ